jgi:hypothetical protein
MTDEALVVSEGSLGNIRDIADAISRAGAENVGRAPQR